MDGCSGGNATVPDRDVDA